MTDAAPHPAPRPTRRTSLAARGDPAVWLMSSALITCLAMIAVLLAVIAYQGMRTFWPAPIHRVTLAPTSEGTAPLTFLGLPVADEHYAAPPSELQRLQARRDAGDLPAGALDDQGRPVRRLYRVGNRDIGQDPFRWVPLHTIASIERPADAVLLEREAWGIWLGSIRAIVLVDDLGPDASFNPDAPPTPTQTDVGPGLTTHTRVTDAAGRTTVERRTRVLIADLAVPFSTLHTQARQRRHQVDAITKQDLGRLNASIERLRLELRAAELRAAAPPKTSGVGVHAWAWALVVSLGVGLVAAGSAARRGMPVGEPSRRRRLGACLWCLAVPVLLYAVLEHPWASRTLSPERLSSIRTSIAERERALRGQYDRFDARRLELQAADQRWRAEVVEPTSNRFAPRSLTEPAEPLPISSIVRIVPANELSLVGAAGVYLSRWGEFLLGDPRSENTEGGVFPVIFGTVLLTLLLTIVVVPLGVVAAIYIREYARQGLLISVLRVAINNLAGVPSIVYGVFGLGFFCYTMGRFIDTGPESPLPPAAGIVSWWPLLIVTSLVAIAAISLGLVGTPPRGVRRRTGWAAASAATVWLTCAALAIALIATSPYFHGFFASKAPSPTFGTRGILWGALTLALLTLPVVIVATEEAIAAVPRSMREGSHACGATSWQTIRNIVLPGAAPGILTGAILAMARGAGEVAPLMLVGAAKQAPDLPLSTDFPFIHADRAFMHLGFHIYDLGLQSPDSQAARPLVWTTTLLLLLVVLAMNLFAIILRSRLRAKSVSAAT